MNRAGTQTIGNAPGVIVGAALVVAVIIGFIGGLIYTEMRPDEATAAAVQTAPTPKLAALAEAADNPPPCTDLIAPGRRVEQVLSEIDTGPCLDAKGDTYIAITVSWDCPDGSTVHQIGEYGWGRTGQTWNGPEVPEPYGDCVLPGADPAHP